MKTIALLLLALLGSAAGAQTPVTHYYSCSGSDGKCGPPPIPPTPPTPPVPPQLPTPPAPPPLPEIPAAAHAACSGKSAGTSITYVISKNELMRGNCRKYGDQMLFVLDSHSKYQ